MLIAFEDKQNATTSNKSPAQNWLKTKWEIVVLSSPMTGTSVQVIFQNLFLHPKLEFWVSENSGPWSEPPCKERECWVGCGLEFLIVFNQVSNLFYRPANCYQTLRFQLGLEPSPGSSSLDPGTVVHLAAVLLSGLCGSSPATPRCIHPSNLCL